MKIVYAKLKQFKPQSKNNNILQDIQDSLENLEVSFLEHEEIGSAESTNSTAKVGAKCFIEQTGKVNCSDIIYEDEKSWRKSRLQIDLLIKVFKNKINDLKDIKKHLRENKPIHMKDYEEVGSVEDEVDTDKAIRRNQRKHNHEIGRRNKTHFIEPKAPALDDADGERDMSVIVTDKNDVTLPFDRISYDFSTLSTTGKESLITGASMASAAVTKTTTTSTPTTTTTATVTPLRPNHKPKTNRTQSTGHHHRNHGMSGRRGQVEELNVSSSTSSSGIDSMALSTHKPKDKSTTRLPKQHSTLSSIRGKTDSIRSRTSSSTLASEMEAIDIDDTTRAGGYDEDNVWKESTEKFDTSNRTSSST